MNDRHLVIRDNVVENVVVFNGGPWTPPIGTTITLVTQELSKVTIGWIFSDGRWMPPQPFPSWVFNEVSFVWEAPVPYPDDGGIYEWDEYSSGWVAV